MTFEALIAFAIAMFAWTGLPGPGLAVVLSRTLGSGPKAGLAVVTGLVAADLIFLGIAFIGLLAIAKTMGPLFQTLKYVGAAYLIWRGYRMIVDAANPAVATAATSGNIRRDIGLGLLATLGNPKAILFFGAILPTFVDVASAGAIDFLVLAAIVTSVSFLIYGGCIGLASRTRRLLSSAKAVRRLGQATGTVLVGSGIAVATR